MPQDRRPGAGPRGAGHHGRPHRGRRGARCRWPVGPGRWEVHARVERFVEPALLLLLREGETHGYDLAEALAGLAPDDEVDLGNLYRLLRSLEDEELVVSRWRDDLPGRAKRTYALTAEGRALLDAWAEALDRAGATIAAFRSRYGDPGTNEPETNEPETNEPETNGPETNGPETNGKGTAE